MPDDWETLEGSVAKLIRDRRAELGYSQDALAQRMRTAGKDSWRQTTVAKAEHPDKGSRRALSLTDALALALALGVPRLEDVFGEESEAVRTRLITNYVEREQAALERATKFAAEFLAQHDPNLAARFEEMIAAIDQASVDAKADLADADPTASAQAVLLARLAEIDPELAALARAVPASEKGDDQ